MERHLFFILNLVLFYYISGLWCRNSCVVCRDRVVAVFVQGPAWQFKGWPCDNPVDIFSRSTSSLFLPYYLLQIFSSVSFSYYLFHIVSSGHLCQIAYSISSISSILFLSSLLYYIFHHFHFISFLFHIISAWKSYPYCIFHLFHVACTTFFTDHCPLRMNSL